MKAELLLFWTEEAICIMKIYEAATKVLRTIFSCIYDRARKAAFSIYDRARKAAFSPYANIIGYLRKILYRLNSHS